MLLRARQGRYTHVHDVDFFHIVCYAHDIFKFVLSVFIFTLCVSFHVVCFFSRFVCLFVCIHIFDCSTAIVCLRLVGSIKL